MLLNTLQQLPAFVWARVFREMWFCSRLRMKGQVFPRRHSRIFSINSIARKRQTGASNAPVCRFRAIEFIENMRECLRGNTWPFILNREQNHISRNTRAHTNAGSCWSVFSSIVEKIYDCLFEKKRVDRDQRKIIGQIKFYMMVLSLI